MSCAATSGESLMNNKDDIQKKIREDEDYIRCPKFSNSLSKFLAKNPDGVDDNSISRFLMMSEEDIEELYKEAVGKLRAEMVEKE